MDANPSGVLRLVLVDDDASFRAMTRAVLEQDERIEIVGEAANGVQALLLIERLQPDAALVDLDIPALAGLELIRLLEESWPAWKVVVVTGSEEPADEAAALGLGATQVISKRTASIETIGRALLDGR